MASSTASSTASTVPSRGLSSSTSPSPLEAMTTAISRSRTAQHKRRSHKKSRHGCGSCKRFHVKCDESGPPCGNCVLRQVPCVYPTAKAAGEGPAHLARPAGGGGGSSDGGGRAGPGAGRAAVPSRGLTVGGGGDDRLLELELMHRWSVRTYAGFVSIAEDVHYAQMVVPRAALQHHALLSGVMACAALDLAMASTGAQQLAYARQAMRQYERASAAFGEQSLHITADNHHVLVYLGVLLVVYHIAFTQIGREPSILPQLGGIFSLLCNNSAIARRHWEWICNSPFPMLSHLRVARNPAPVSLLDQATRAACARLRSLNSRLHGGEGEPLRAGDATCRASYPSDAERLDAAVDTAVFSLPMAPESSGPAPNAPPADPATYRFYHNAIAVLEGLFAEEVRGTLKGGCMAFPAMSRRHPTAGVRRSEALELLLLMHWGVLLQMEAAYYWWIGKTGKMLVAECCDAFCRTGPFGWQEPECVQSVAWARQQVGLPDLVV